jgi:hypothetical protein
MPVSNFHSHVELSLVTATVNPTALATFPVVNTTLGSICSIYFKNCDFEVPRSLRSKILTSPEDCVHQLFFGFCQTLLRKLELLFLSDQKLRV